MMQLSGGILKAFQRLVGLADNTQILIGQLPDELPVELPFFDEAQLVGSFVIQPDYFRILFDVLLPLDETRNLYREHFLNLGWQEQELFPQDYKGFIAAPKVVQRRINQTTKFWHKQQEIELCLELNPCPDESQTTNLFLTFVKSPKSETLEVLKLPPFPPLENPPDVKRINSSGADSEGYSSHVHLLSNLKLHELLSHYSAQFEQNGWEVFGSGQDGVVVWKSWTMKGIKEHDWVGLLNITQLGGVQDQFVIYVRVFRQE